MLFTDNEAVSLHTKAEVPGTADTISKDTRSRNINITSNLNYSKDESKLAKSKLRGQVEKEIQQNIQNFEKNEKEIFGEVLEKMKFEPSLAERKVIENDCLLTSLKYVDRILNNITYHKQYILYRNYPEVRAEKIFADEEMNRRKRNIIQEKQEEEVKFEHLQHLFKFSC
jgi:hypothetical protein